MNWEIRHRNPLPLGYAFRAYGARPMAHQSNRPSAKLCIALPPLSLEEVLDLGHKYFDQD